MLKQKIATWILLLLKIISILVFILGISFAFKSFGSLNGVSNHSNTELDAATLNEITEILSQLQKGYTERNPGNIDQMQSLFNEYPVPTVIGTSPGEMFKGWDSIKGLLLWDWAYWGDVDFNFENAYVYIEGDSAEVVLNGVLKSQSYRINFPLRGYIVLENINEEWLISKMTFNFSVVVEFLVLSIMLISFSFVLLLVTLIIGKISQIRKYKNS